MPSSLVPDIRTMIENYVFLNIVCVIVLIPIWVRNKNRFRGTGVWIISFSVMVFGMALISFRGIISDLFSVVLANAAMITGVGLSAWGLEIFSGRKPSWKIYLPVIVIYTVAQGWFTWGYPDIGIRRMIFSLALVLLSARIIYFTFRVVPGSVRKFIYGVGILYIFYFLTSLAGVMKFIFSSRGRDDFFRPDIFEALSIFIYEMLFISLVFVIILMFNRKLLSQVVLQEDKFRKAFHTSPWAMVISRFSDGKITEVNEGFLKASGYSNEEVIGRDSLELRLFLNEGDRTMIMDELSERGKISQKEIMFSDKGGRSFLCIFSAELITVDGEPLIISSLNNISELKEAEEKLKASNDKYRLLAENGSDVIWLFDISLNRFTYVSPSVQLLRGYSVEEVLEQSMEDAMTPESYEVVAHDLPGRFAAFAAGDPAAVTQVHEIIQTRKDGGTVPTEVVTTLIAGENGELLYIQGVSRDITERKAAEANLLKQIELQERMTKIALTVPGMIFSFRLSSDGRMSLPYSTEIIMDLWGYTPEELRDDFSIAFDRVHPDDMERARINIAKSAEKLIPWRDTFRVLHPVKGELWIEGNSVPKMEEDGSIIWYGFAQDISERMKIELAMRESEKRYRELVQSANSAIIRWTSDGEILFFNDFALKFFGYSEAEVIGKNIGILVPETESTGRDLSTLVEMIVVQPDRYISQVNENICKDGRRVWLAWNNRAIFDRKGRLKEILAVGVDITERKLVEEALLASRAELKTALESITDAIFISDAEGRFIDFNEAFATFHKFRNKDECARTLAEYPDFLEVTFPDGRVAPLEQWAVPRALRGESVTNAEYHLRRKDTGERWIGSYSFAPIHDSEGAVVGSVVVGRDISEEKAAEIALRESEEAYRQLSEELEKRVMERTAQLENAVKELEAFSYSVSHDLRAPLRAVHSYTKILREDYDKEFDDEGKRLCGVIESSAIHMGQLIDDLLAFSRVGRTELTRDIIDMKALATNVYEDLTDHKIDGKCFFTVDDLPPAVGDHTTIRLVLTNLISNAVKYSSREEIPEIQVGFNKIDGETIYHIRDNGVGFKMEYAGKLFGVFQRLHSLKDFEGNGVGLAIVQRIIHRHGGRVWADAAPGKGATFYFTIPAA